MKGWDLELVLIRLTFDRIVTLDVHPSSLLWQIPRSNSILSATDDRVESTVSTTHHKQKNTVFSLSSAERSAIEV
jgi:hypothetical protein